MNTPYTIEELIEKLTQFAASRGWGPQSTTNINSILSTSGSREVKLLNGNEKDIEKLEDELREESIECRSLNGQVTRLERERDALQDRVAHLIAEVQSLKEEIRDMNA